MVAHSSTYEAESGESGLQGHPQPQGATRGQLGLHETYMKETGEEWIRGGNRRGVGKIDWEERMEGKLRPGCKKRRKE